MIKTIDQNILDAEVDIIAHCCNCYCIMGAGVAAAIRKEYPEAYDADCKTTKGDKNKLGTVSLTVVQDVTQHKNQNIKAICNIYGQFGLGGERAVDYEAIYTGLVAFRDKLKPAVKSISLPYKMGSDLAGGDWRIIEKMIEVVFENSHVDVIISKYTPPSKI